MGAVFSRRKKFRKTKIKLSSDTDTCTNPDFYHHDTESCSLSMKSENADSVIIPSTQPKLMRNMSLLDTPNHKLRIHPLEQDGCKLSDTHYFMFNEPKHRRYHSTKERCNPIEAYANCSRLFNQSQAEPMLPFELNNYCIQHERHDSNSHCRLTNHQHHNSLPIRRGRSDTTDYLYNNRRALIARMRMKIPQATDVESHGVLMGTNWNFEEAERRLKMELVHRVNGANYKECESLLQQHRWDLDSTLHSVDCNSLHKLHQQQQQHQSGSWKESYHDDRLSTQQQQHEEHCPQHQFQQQQQLRYHCYPQTYSNHPPSSSFHVINNQISLPESNSSINSDDSNIPWSNSRL